jgi:hypothetical protein
VQKSRRLVLGCLVGMVANWRRAGMPQGKHAMGGFDQWAAVVGGIMAHHGFTNWMQNTTAWRETADTFKGDLKALVVEWSKSHPFPPHTATVPELFAIAQRLELFTEILTGRAAQDRGALTAFGMRVLGRNLDRPVGSHIIRRRSSARPAQYTLESADVLL